MRARVDRERLGVLLGASLAFALAAVFVLPTPSAAARTLCVDAGPHCFRSLPKAIRAAHEGDTVRLGEGTYVGPIQIRKSITLRGKSAQKTTITGGGPVVTIGRLLGTHPPRVEISRLGIRGGVTHGDGVEALGGGIYIPPAKGYRQGASVVLTT